MSNVLPLEEKKKLLRQFYVRFLSVASVMCILGAGVASVALLPAFITIRIAEAALQKSEAAITEATKSDQAQQTRATVLLKALMPIATASTSPADALQRALSPKPKGMSITSIRYKKGEIVLMGVAANREAVGAYRDILKLDPGFSSVTVPVAALVGSQEGRFTITLSGAF